MDDHARDDRRRDGAPLDNTTDRRRTGDPPGPTLYQQIDVWRRAPDEVLVRYRCLKLLPEGTYTVQSADFYRKSSGRAQIAYLDDQFRELLAESAPDVRSAAHPTLERAIAAFDETFSAP